MIRAIEQGRELDNIPGLIKLNEIDKRPDDRNESARTAVEDWNSMIIPAHGLCRYRKYLRRGGSVSIQSKRGRVFHCIYCVYSQLEGNRCQLRSTDRVTEEIKRIAEDYANCPVYFVDAVFNYPSGYCRELCRKITDLGIRIRWMAYCNPLEFDDELAAVMKDAGCIGLEFGLDSVTEQIIATMCKPFTQKQIEKALRAAAKQGIPFAIPLLFGGPGETPEGIQRAQDFLDMCDPANAVFASLGLRIYRSTPLETIAIQQGVIDKDADLFYPRYYLSHELGPDPVATLDEIASRRDQWTTATD